MTKVFSQNTNHVLTASRLPFSKSDLRLSCSKTSTRSRLPVVYARCQQGVDMSRRDIGLITVAMTLVTTSPAYALFGIGESRKEEYENETSDLLLTVESIVSLDRDDPVRDEQITKVRSLTNKWVAKYRRDDRFAGKPSYSNTYSVVNALQGHFNSFGTEAPLPKKRLERMMKEVSDAERFLSRGR